MDHLLNYIETKKLYLILEMQLWQNNLKVGRAHMVLWAILK